MPLKRVQLYLSHDCIATLNAAAATIGRSPGWLANLILKEYAKRVAESYLAAQDARK